MEKVSVVIPVYDSEKTIQQCIETVLGNKYPYFEVIVVDDCSTDLSRKIIGNVLKKRSFTFLQNKENRGPGFTRNRGIRIAKGDIIILLDSDSYVQENWIEQHVKAHEEKGILSAHIIGGGIEGIHDTISGRCDGYFNSVLNVPRSKSFFLKRFHLPTNNMSIKKKVFGKIGYFIEDAKSGEDVVFCHLALKNKLKIYFKSGIIVHHYDRNGFKEFLRHQAMWGEQAIRTRKKMKMDHSYLLPNSYLMAHFYIVPLAIIFTAHVIYKWIRYEPSVLLYSPLLFLSKLVHANAIKDSLKHKKAG